MIASLGHLPLENGKAEIDVRRATSNVTNSVALKKIRVTGWRWPLAIVAAVVTLALIVAGTLRPVSHAATGEKWLTGVPFAGFLLAGTSGCTATVVSEFLAITAKHCPTSNPTLILNVSALTQPGHAHAVKEFRTHPTMDVTAIFLRDRSGITVTPLRETMKQNDEFYVWGYGSDLSNAPTRHLTRAEFNEPKLCGPDLPAASGAMCWDTTEQNSVCAGDSGGPVTQNGAIIAMLTSGLTELGAGDCSTTAMGQAIPLVQIQPWLDEMIDDANPFPT